MAKRRGLHGRTIDELFEDLKEFENVKISDRLTAPMPAPAPPDKCRVRAGVEVRNWEGRLTPSQCERLPPGKELGRGSFATAYEHANDPEKVVKFTADKEDAVSAAIVAREKPIGTVQIYDVVQLKGQKAKAPVRDQSSTSTSPDFVAKPDQPVFGIVAEKLGEMTHAQKAAVMAFWNKYRGRSSSPDAPRNVASRTKPKDFRIDNLLDRREIRKECVARGGSSDKCYAAVEDIMFSVDELASIGIVPLDLHMGNWGNQKGSLVILDLGVSAGQEAPPAIPQLAGVKKSRARRKK